MQRTKAKTGALEGQPNLAERRMRKTLAAIDPSRTKRPVPIRFQDLSVLAGNRQAERAKRRQRERVAFGKQDRQTVFAQRRLQQLNDWRARFDK